MTSNNNNNENNNKKIYLTNWKKKTNSRIN